MIKLLGSIPRQKIWVACSGGVDSVVAVDFLRRSHDIGIAFFHHGTKTSDEAIDFITSHKQFNNLTIAIDYCKKEKPSELSMEEFWRNERYTFLEKLKEPVITAHHLDDAVETYIWRMCNGRSDTIPYKRNNIIRPFLITPKQELLNWAHKNNLIWKEDMSNQDTSYTRNYIRTNVVPHLLKVNPGLPKIVAKKYTGEQDVT